MSAKGKLRKGGFACIHSLRRNTLTVLEAWWQGIVLCSWSQCSGGEKWVLCSAPFLFFILLIPGHGMVTLKTDNPSSVKPFWKHLPRDTQRHIDCYVGLKSPSSVLSFYRKKLKSIFHPKMGCVCVVILSTKNAHNSFHSLHASNLLSTCMSNWVFWHCGVLFSGSIGVCACWSLHPISPPQSAEMLPLVALSHFSTRGYLL